jgi:hypothetical protein
MSQVIFKIEGTESVDDFAARDFTGTRKAALALTVMLIVLVVSCRDADTIWSAEARSPDGQWLAVAQTDQYGGPGTAGVITTVYLKRTKGPKTPIDILTLSQSVPSIGLKMNWLESSRLEITYTQQATVQFQAVKCGGVDISVRDLSTPSIAHPG